MKKVKKNHEKSTKKKSWKKYKKNMKKVKKNHEKKYDEKIMRHWHFGDERKSLGKFQRKIRKLSIYYSLGRNDNKI